MSDSERKRPGPRYKPGHGEPRAWGGKRTGSGRKKRIEAAAEKAAAVVAAPSAPASVAPENASTEDVIAIARKFAPFAVRVLAQVAKDGRRESARVAAASKLIEIARLPRMGDMEEPEPEPLGKKAQALEAARAAATDSEWGNDLAPPSYRN